jgi:hypothetical protein
VTGGDPAFADYAEGMEMLMPEWFDDDFIEAVVDVAANLPDPRRRYDPRPTPTAKALADRLRARRPS